MPQPFSSLSVFLDRDEPRSACVRAFFHPKRPEGSSAIINCTYVDSASLCFPCYKQEPGKHPKLSIGICSAMERKETLRILLDKKAKPFSLHIINSLLTKLCTSVPQVHPAPQGPAVHLSSNLQWGLKHHPHPVPQAFQYSISQLLVFKCQR